jgi:Holliday junction resolvase RusA-like endonuclease
MKTITYTIPGSIRSKKNSKRIIHVGTFSKLIPSKAYLDWEKQARAAMWVQKADPDLPLICLVHVEAHFFFRGPQPDLSGCLESIADCLEGILWADDRQIESWDGSRLHHDLNNPRTEVTVRW